MTDTETLADLAQRLLDDGKLTRPQFCVWRMAQERQTQREIAAFLGTSKSTVGRLYLAAVGILANAQGDTARTVIDCGIGKHRVLARPNKTLRGWIDAERQELLAMQQALEQEATKFRQEQRNIRREKRRAEREAEREILRQSSENT